jgi:hypothetical protein
VKGEDGKFEEEAAHDHADSHHGRRFGIDLVQPGQQLCKIGGAGQPEQIAHAEQHDAGSHDAVEDILDGRLHLDPQPAAVIAHRHQQIE